MEKENIMLAGLLAIVLGGLIFSLTSFQSSQADIKGITQVQNNQAPAQGKPASLSESSKGSGFETKSTGSTETGDVAIDLTPQGINDGQLTVNIGANTHSVDLSQFDLSEMTTLEYNGKSVNPASASTLKGHHSSGTLVFDVDNSIKGFVIKIKGIPAVEERVFEWDAQTL